MSQYTNIDPARVC